MARKTTDTPTERADGAVGGARAAFGVEIARLHERLVHLQAEADALLACNQPEATPQAHVIEAAFADLSTALEELHVAEEELGVQQEELALAHLVAEEARQRYQDLFDSAPDGYLVTDLSGGIQEVNHAAETLLGTPASVLQRKPLVLFVEKESRKAYHACLGRVRAGEPVAELEVRLQPRGRPPFPAALAFGRARGPGGGAHGLRILVRDLTARKRAEEGRRRSEERFSKAFRAAPIPISLAALADGRLLDVNARYCELTGRAREDLLGRSSVALGVLDAATRARLVAAAVASDPAPHEVRITTAGGDVREALVAVALVGLDGETREEGVLAMYLDLSARRRLEREVLAVVAREQRRFAQDLHDGLGSHLTGVAMLARVLAGAARAGEAVQPEAIDEIAALVQDGVEQARALAHGLDPIELESRGLPDALGRLAAETARRTGVACRCEPGPALPVLAGEAVTHLYRIAQEAVHNAVRHAHARLLTIRLAAEAAAGPRLPGEGGSVLRLEVEDDGRGLPAAEPGTPRAGLGLHTMRYRAHLIGAALAVENGPAGGVRVTCRLPLSAVTGAPLFSTE